MWAIIGGSGFEEFEDVTLISMLSRATPFGECSSGLKKVRIGNQEVIFLPRHGAHHELLPSEINYRANIFALKMHGASKLLSISAVGSLRQELKLGDLVVPSQFFDRTKSLRRVSFCGEGVVGHVSLAEPVTRELVLELKKLKTEFDFDIHFERASVCIEGPYFSTRLESQHYRDLGADVIGMTAFPEFALAREAGICYLPCSFVTDYDSWDATIPHATFPEILAVMKENKKKAYRVLKLILPKTEHLLTNGCPELGLKTGILGGIDHLSTEQKSWLAVLFNGAETKFSKQEAKLEETA